MVSLRLDSLLGGLLAFAGGLLALAGSTLSLDVLALLGGLLDNNGTRRGDLGQALGRVRGSHEQVVPAKRRRKKKEVEREDIAAAAAAAARKLKTNTVG